MARIFVTRRIEGDALDRLQDAHDLIIRDEPLPPEPDELRAAAAQADGLLTLLTDRVDEPLLDAAPELKVIANYAVGTDNIDLDACKERGIPVGRTPDVLTDATADLAMALMLAVARRLPEAAQAVQKGEWKTFEATRWLGRGLDGKRLLIVGPGRIGKAVAKRAAGFGMDIDAAGRDDDLKAKLAEADVVSVHAPLTPDTHHLIDARDCKPDAILVNTARGPLVDPDALAQALHDRHLFGAGLDVTDPEPLPADHPLLQAPNLLVLPHIGSATTEARHAMTEICVANLEAGLNDEPLPYPA